MSSAPILAYATYSDLSSDSQPMGTYGQVMADPDPASNGYYLSNGGMSWTRLYSYKFPDPTSVVRFLPDKISESVSVQDFGAPTGTNDTVTFQNAVAALAGSGGVLFVPFYSGGYFIDDGAIVLNNLILFGIHIIIQGGTVINYIGGASGKAITITAGLLPTDPKHRITGGVFVSQTPGYGTCIWIEDCGSQMIDNVEAQDFDKGFAIHNAAHYSEQNIFLNCRALGGNFGWWLSMDAGAKKSMATTTWIACSASSGTSNPWTGLFIDSGVSIYRANFDGLVLFPTTSGAVGFGCNGSITSARGKLNFEDNVGASGSIAIQIGADSTGLSSHDISSDIRGVTTNYQLNTTTGSPFQTTVISAPSIATHSTSSTGGSLPNSTTYYYTISANNPFGSASPQSAEITQATGSGGSGTNTITLTWAPVTGASSYNVYRSVSSGQELLLESNISASPYVDNGSLTPAGTGPLVGGNTVAGASVYARPFFWRELDSSGGAAEILSTLVTTTEDTVFRSIDDTNGVALGGLQRSTAGAWKQMFDGPVRMTLALGGGIQQLGFTGGSVTTTSGATPSVADLGQGGTLIVSNTGATTITDLADQYDGQIVTLYFTNANTTLGHSTTLRLAGEVNYTPPAFAMVTLIYHSHWKEIARTDPTVVPSTPLAQNTAVVSVSSGVATIDLSIGATIWTLQPTAAITSWTFLNPPPSGTYAEFTIIFQQNGSTAYSVASPATSTGGKTAGSAWSPSAILSSYQSLGIRLSSAGVADVFPSAVMV